MTASPTSLPEELGFIRVFDAYWQEVHALRERIQTRRGEDPTLSPEAVRLRIQRFLEEKSSEFGRHTESFEYQQFRQVLYLMAALADETFLAFDWPGRLDWSESLIEKALFDSHDAGVRFFDLLEDLLEARDSSQRSVAVIYLLALALGFKGKFYGTDRCDENLAAYRARLYNFIYGSRPGRRLEGVPLCPQTAWYNASGQAEKFPSIARWFFIGSLIIVAVMLASHGAWLLGTSDIHSALTEPGSAP
ncbi:MAG: DotU family type IV/VI secretion system protein [Myxococcales bacterium]|nr:DotU family type IV/VI secretion system protein [Myxococcales bacterium]